MKIEVPGVLDRYVRKYPFMHPNPIDARSPAQEGLWRAYEWGRRRKRFKGYTFLIVTEDLAVVDLLWELCSDCLEDNRYERDAVLVQGVHRLMGRIENMVGHPDERND